MSINSRRHLCLLAFTLALALTNSACDQEAPTEVRAPEIAPSELVESLATETTKEFIDYVACLVTPGTIVPSRPDLGTTNVGEDPKSGVPFAIQTVAGGQTRDYFECSAAVFDHLLATYCKAGYSEPVLRYGVSYYGNLAPPVTSSLLSKEQLTCAATNSAPTITRISLPAEPVQLGLSATVSAEFEDLDTGDSHHGQIIWGDLYKSDFTLATGDRGIAGSHTYGAAGVYTVSVVVVDAANTSHTRSSNLDVPAYIVIYDPAGGFVTGGGWIDSPVGAYAADPGLSGKASFGFVSKYQKGATVPSGNTQFQFHAASFQFRSTSYDWLVISGARAQYKGSGAVNGAGDYSFMLTAIDGQVNGGGDVDRFRLKVWDKATEAVLYDNELGTTDGADPATTLGGGSIVIHKAK